jgi:hypothetical protein
MQMVDCVNGKLDLEFLIRCYSWTTPWLPPQVGSSTTHPQPEPPLVQSQMNAPLVPAVTDLPPIVFVQAAPVWDNSSTPVNTAVANIHLPIKNMVTSPLL